MVAAEAALAAIQAERSNQAQQGGMAAAASPKKVKRKAPKREASG